MSKFINRILVWVGIKEYIWIYNTKKKSRAYIAMTLAEFVTWMVKMIPIIANANGITPLALATEIKKYVKDETRKEEQDAEPTQADLSDPIVDHRDSDISKH